MCSASRRAQLRIRGVVAAHLHCSAKSTGSIPVGFEHFFGFDIFYLAALGNRECRPICAVFWAVR